MAAGGAAGATTPGVTTVATRHGLHGGGPLADHGALFDVGAGGEGDGGAEGGNGGQDAHGRVPPAVDRCSFTTVLARRSRADPG